MAQKTEVVSRIPTHPVIGAAIAAYDGIRQWADGMLVGHTEFNVIFYEVIALLGKIKAGVTLDEVTKVVDEVAFQLCQLSEFFEKAPFNVKSYEELSALGKELVRLREEKLSEVIPRESALVAQISVAAPQDLNPILQAIAGLDNKLGLVLSQHVVQVASEQPVILADSKKGDVQECKVVLARYREWLHSVLEFEVAMRDERASFLDNQDALKYGASDIDRSTELWAIEQLLNGLVEIRRPIEEASREIEGYLAAWNIVNRGVQAKHLNVTLPAFKDDQAKSMMTVPVVPQKVEKVSVVVQAVPTKESLKDRKLLAMLGECVKANPAEVLFVTFFEIVKTNRKMGGRGPSRGYNAMMRHALESGLAQKFGWKKVADLEKEFQSAPLTSIVRGDLLRSNGCVQGNLVLSRTTIPLPWAVYDLFTDEEVTRFIQLINKK